MLHLRSRLPKKVAHVLNFAITYVFCKIAQFAKKNDILRENWNLGKFKDFFSIIDSANDFFSITFPNELLW